MSIEISASVTGCFLDLYLTLKDFFRSFAIFPASIIANFVDCSILEIDDKLDNYLPPKVRFSTKTDGALTL